MKLLLLVALVGWTVVAQEPRPLTAEEKAHDAAILQFDPDDSNTTEAILTTIIAVLGVLLKVYAGWNRKNDAIAKTLIRGIEMAANSSTVKAAVRTLAAEEGNTSIIHKKVQKTIANDATPPAASPSASDQVTQ